MENELKLIIKEYIKNVDSVCSNLLKGLDLNTKDDFWEYKKTEGKMKYKVNGIIYIFHGRGCIATNSKLFLDWDFGYGSRWCGINPRLLAWTLEKNKEEHVEYYNSNKIKKECEEAVITGEMYQKYDLYYFVIPINQTFEPDFPKEFDELIIEHFNSRWVIPRNKVIDRFLRKSKRVYDQIEKSNNLYTLKFMLNKKEVYSIPYDDVGYPENAVKIMSDIIKSTDIELL